MKLAESDYTQAVREAIDADNMHSPCVRWNVRDGFFVAPSMDLIPPVADGRANHEFQVWQANRSADGKFHPPTWAEVRRSCVRQCE